MRSADDVVADQGAIASIRRGNGVVDGLGAHTLDGLDTGCASVDAAGAIGLEDLVTISRSCLWCCPSEPPIHDARN